MKIHADIQLNNWEIKKFLGVILAIQIVMLILIGIEQFGIRIPIIRPLIGFIYLIYVPGALILRILNLHKLDIIEALLYSAGLSIITVMVTGISLNAVFLLFGITQPVSLLPLTVTISLIVFVLCFICFKADRNFSKPDTPVIMDIPLSPVLFLCLLPFLAVIGTYIMNFYHTNILLLLLIFIIIFINLLIAFDKFIPKKLFPFAVLMIAISILFHNSLISPYIIGYDIQSEFYYANLVLTSGFWNSAINNYLNSMLSIVMLAPIYSLILNLNIIWVFKIIYPLIFALVPLGLYRVFHSQTNEKVAFMSVFFFMALAVFFTEMLYLARQQIAELFLVLLLLLLINKNMDKFKWSLLFIAFSLSLVLSHYGLTYIIIGSIILLLLFNYLYDKIRYLFFNKANPTRKMSFILVLPLVIFTIIWYLNTSDSGGFFTIVVICTQILRNLVSNFLNPESAQGMAIISSTAASQLLAIFKYLLLFTQFCIVIGLISAFLLIIRTRFSKDYFGFAFIFILILIASIAVPFFASAMNTTRLYQISLIFLAPFFVIGWLAIFKIMRYILRIKDIGLSTNFSLQVLSLFLAIYLLFNSGVVFELLHDNTPMSFSLNGTIDLARYDQQEVLGAQWLLNEKNLQWLNNDEASASIYGDGYRSLLLMGYYNNTRALFDDFNEMPDNSYIFLGTLNTRDDQVLAFKKKDGVSVREYVDTSDLVGNRSKIYANGGAGVYH
jgi:uncharacterized membrane protein